MYEFLISVSIKEYPLRSVSDQIRFLPEYKAWRNAIYERDKKVCQHCGVQGRQKNETEIKDKPVIHADHIIPFSYLIKKNGINQSIQALVCPEIFDLNNGRTLCIDCHVDTDTYGSKVRKFDKKMKMYHNRKK